MKYIGLVVLLTVSNFANASVLKCWDTYSKKGAPPTLTANIDSNSQLSLLTITSFDGYKYKNNVSSDGKAFSGVMIISSRSPYKGNQEFLLPEFRLILPARLDNQSLVASQKTGIGMGGGENGVIIGQANVDDPGAGTHFSTRLRCRAY